MIRPPLARPQAACEEEAMFKDTTIVFDLDGTLVDTAPDLTNALNDVLTRRGHRPVSLGDDPRLRRPRRARHDRGGFAPRRRRGRRRPHAGRVPGPLRGQYRRREPALSRRGGGARGLCRARRDPRRLHQQARKLEPAPAPGARHRPLFRRHRRARHLCGVEARSGPSDRDDRACRRRPRPRA